MRQIYCELVVGSYMSSMPVSRHLRVTARVTLCLLQVLTGIFGQDGVLSSEVRRYPVGPGDELSVTVVGLKDLPDTPTRVSSDGEVDLPMIGRLRVLGMTLPQIQAALTDRLKSIMHEPEVSVRIVRYESQPVSVLGAVVNPGVHQVQGRRTLAEMLSLAGGLKPDAGYQIKITRLLKHGPLPLPRSVVDPTGGFSIGEVNAQDLLAGRVPQFNILIAPEDVISVPTAEMVYVLGLVRKPGGFTLKEKQTMTVLQALALAEGLEKTAAPGKARIIRPAAGETSKEVAVNLTAVMNGKQENLNLRANDILVVPDSLSKKVAIRALEAAVQAGTGIMIWRQ